MENATGFLRVRVVGGVDLAKRDVNGSDAYVVVCIGDQRMQTNAKKNSLNPEWNEDLSFCLFDAFQPLKLEVFDKDTFTSDDKMGDAELDLQPFVEAAAKITDWDGLRDGTVIRTMSPSSQNCLVMDCHIAWKDGLVVQDDIVLRLRNAESGRVKLQLAWIHIPPALNLLHTA